MRVCLEVPLIKFIFSKVTFSASISNNLDWFNASIVWPLPLIVKLFLLIRMKSMVSNSGEYV